MASKSNDNEWPNLPTPTDVPSLLAIARERYPELSEEIHEAFDELGASEHHADKFEREGDISPEGVEAIEQAKALGIFNSLNVMTSSEDIDIPLVVVGEIETLEGSRYFEVFSTAGEYTREFYSGLRGKLRRHRIWEWFTTG